MQTHRAVILLMAAFLGSCGGRTAPPAPVYERGASDTGAPGTSVAQPMISHPDQIAVERGETLYAVSRRYGVPVRSLIEANHLAAPYKLNTGMVLKLPQVRQHIVQPGDTLTSVAGAYGVDASSLARANQLQPPYTIKIGQALIMPAEAERVPAPAPNGNANAVAAAPLPPPARPGLEKHAQTAKTEPPKPPGASPEEKTAALPAPPVPSSPAPVLPPSKQEASAHGFIWPVQGRIISGYGTAENGTHNDGVNIAAPADTPVLAAAPGVVAYAGNELRGYGNLVLIKHEGGYLTAYAHNAALLVKRGDKVARGQPIARVGATGAVAEPQLHFEIRSGSRAVDPTPLLPPIAAAAAGG